MIFTRNTPLSSYTSFGCGGAAETLAIVQTGDSLADYLDEFKQPTWFLGYGANSLVSDKGLPGTVIAFRNSHISVRDNTLIADAGVWWDDLVEYAIQNNLWGIELTSAIPGSVGAAICGNVAAYGQSAGDHMVWAEAINTSTGQLTTLRKADMQLGYRTSVMQQSQNSNLVITRAAFELHSQPQSEVTYQGAIDAANELKVDLNTLVGRRQAVLLARQNAGAIWNHKQPQNYPKTAGSFFRNPLVSAEQAEQIMNFDESGKSKDLLKKMNQVHGGDSRRVSAAHVMLAAGFKRGQTWGPVRLHPSHVLKIENTGNATSQQIYDVAQEIIQTVQNKLNITLEPEVRFLGEF